MKLGWHVRQRDARNRHVWGEVYAPHFFLNWEWESKIQWISDQLAHVQVQLQLLGLNLHKASCSFMQVSIYVCGGAQVHASCLSPPVLSCHGSTETNNTIQVAGAVGNWDFTFLLEYPSLFIFDSILREKLYF